MRGRWVVWLSLVAPATAAAETTLYVEAATTAEDLTAILAEELPPSAFAETATAADLLVRLTPDLRLSIRDRFETVQVDRLLLGDRNAAVRIAALVIVDAVDAWEPPPPPSPPPPPPPRMVVTSTLGGPAPPHGFLLSYGFDVGLGVATWLAPVRPRLVVAIGGHLRFGDLGVGVTGAIAACCGVDSDEIESTPLGLSAVIEGRWTFWRPARLGISAMVAGGIEAEIVDASVRVFQAPGAAERQSFVGPIARFGLGASVPLAALTLRLDAAAQLQRPVTIALPEGFDGDIRRGIAVPWLLLSIGYGSADQ